ncbi:MAG: hypothetical protein KY446_00785 [Proteobacteria bacterium]|nr:hypothetical protein [Pseudomonadota bacterium]
MGLRQWAWRRVAAAAILSLAFHGALLGGLMLRRAETGAPAPPPIEVALIRPERPETPPRPSVDAADPRPAPTGRLGQERRESPASALSAPVPASPALAPAAPPPPSSPAPSTLPAGPARTPGPRAPSDLSAVAAALRAVDCSGPGPRTARERELCAVRARTTARTAPALGPDPNPRLQAEAAARTAAAAAREEARLRPLPLGVCTGCNTIGGPRRGEGPATNLSDSSGIKIPFGRPPPALPVIPPSTLRGDDDALRPKPRP